MEKDKIYKKYYDLIDNKSKGAIPLFIVVVGSQAYGTNTPESDFDYAGVYIQSKEDIYGFNYKQQIDDKKEKGEFGNKEKDDVVFYEIRRFLELLMTANPTVLSILFSPEDCIAYKHPIFDVILKERQKFVTKKCKNSFAGYAIAQIKKAKGLNKKQNWEKNKVVRKDVLDFCYVIDKNKSIAMNKFLEGRTYLQQFCGVVNIPNSRDMYALFYDEEADRCFNPLLNEKTKEDRKKYLSSQKRPFGFGFKGIVKKGEGANSAESNQLRLSSIPKVDYLGNKLEPIAVFSYNKDGYTQHCKDHREYQDWLKNRNEQRYVDNKGHNQKIDSKNIMHLVRLLKMSREIAENGEFIIRRPDADYLKSIRRGEVNLQEIIDWAEDEILTIDDLFLNSNLPDKVEENKVNELLIKIRKECYERYS